MIAHSPTSNLLPPGVMFLFALSIPYLIGGFLGARLNNKNKYEG
jgi:hypothetical protein